MVLGFRVSWLRVVWFLVGGIFKVIIFNPYGVLLKQNVKLYPTRTQLWQLAEKLFRASGCGMSMVRIEGAMVDDINPALPTMRNIP